MTKASSFPGRILIVRLSAHGDVMQTLPLAGVLKAHDPGIEIGWLVEESAASLLEGHPWIDHLHVSRRKRWLKAAFKPWQWLGTLREVSAFLEELRGEGYDVSLDAQGLLKSAVWPFLAGISERCGFAKAREQADCFYNRKLSPVSIRDGCRPAADQYLDLARHLGISVTELPFAIPPVSDKARMRIAALMPKRDAGKPLVVVAPFTRWASKHWEASYWPRLLEALCQTDVQIAVIGSPGDQAETAPMLTSLPSDQVFNLVGQTDWPDLYALFELAELVIGLDSAPLHIANATGTPKLLGLYGPTHPGRTGPVGDRHRTLSTQLPCQPCFERACPLKTHDCMKQLTPEMVTDAARRMLEVVRA